METVNKFLEWYTGSWKIWFMMTVFFWLCVRFVKSLHLWEVHNHANYYDNQKKVIKDGKDDKCEKGSGVR